MRHDSYRRHLARAQRYQESAANPKHYYAEKAREKFGSHWIVPCIIIVTDIYGYLKEQTSEYKRRRHRKQIDDLEQETVSLNRSLARWTFALAIFSILTFFVSLGTLIVLKGQLHEMHTGGEDTHTLAKAAEAQSKFAQASAQTAQESYVADNRAFIGPSDASISTLQIGKGIKAVLQYKNTGRQPAGVNFVVAVKIYDESTQWGSESAVDIFNNRVSCMASKAPPTSFAFPNSGFSQYQYTVDTEDQQNVVTGLTTVTQSVTDGKSIVTIMGCANYSSLGAMRHTAYCFFFKNGKTDMAHLTFCPNGWDAD